MIDILFLAHKRPKFTRASLKALLENTDLSLHGVDGETSSTDNRLWMMTDGDLETFGEYQDHPLLAGISARRHGGPVACLNGMMLDDGGVWCHPEAEFLCKIDNDTIVPPGWLPACLDLMRHFPNVDLLGIEPWTPDQNLFPRWVEPARLDCKFCANGAGNILPKCPECGLLYDPSRNFPVWPGALSPRPVSHIGGIGVFRRSAFERFGRPVPNSKDRRYGFTEWQWQHPGMVKAFIDPPLPVFLLDHLPFEPWVSLSAKYEAEGIQRPHGWTYELKHRALWECFSSGENAAKTGDAVGGPRL